MEMLVVLALSLVADAVFAELPRPIHPVVWMGKLTSFLERGGMGKPPFFQFTYGVLLTLFLTGLFAIAAYFILFFLEGINLVAYTVVGVLLLKSSFSMRELRQSARRVKELLLGRKLDGARRELRSLVSRDPWHLSEPLVVSAVVESVAENTCDSFVAPLFYFVLFGVPGAIAYRVVNTLDAMIGYHGKYEYLGKFAARLDDVLNYIPARLSALLLVLAAFISNKDGRGAWRGALKDHSLTESPNAGWTMSVVAGALNVQLEKPGHYRLGQGGALPAVSHIDDSLRLVLIASLVWVAICFAAGGIYFALTT